MINVSRLSLILCFSLVGCIVGLPASAQCTIPNQITNGQTTDATKVMGNFSALVGCSNANLSPSGSPQTGSLGVFASPTSLATGNLSGDVTTGGGTATTLSPSGVSAGAYGDGSHVAQITVDAKGRVTTASSVPIAAGAGAGLYALVLSATPTIAGTGLSATLGSSVTESDSTVGVYLLGTNAGMGAYTASVPTAPYSITALLATNQLGGGVISLGWTNGTALQIVYVSPGGIQYIQSNNNIQSFSATNYTSPYANTPHSLYWFKIMDDGANVSFLSSQDGLHFGLLYETTKASGFLGSAGYSHIFVGSPGGSGTSDVTVMSWTQGTN